MEVLVLGLVRACTVALPAVSVSHTAFSCCCNMSSALARTGVLVLLVVGSIAVPTWSCLGLHTTTAVVVAL